MEQFNFYPHVLLPLLIFIAKIFDVSMGTIRILMIAKNKRKMASCLSFFEMFIWVIAISSIMKNLDNFMCCIAYAVGYSAGVYIGMVLEEMISGEKRASPVNTKFRRLIKPGWFFIKNPAPGTVSGNSR